MKTYFVSGIEAFHDDFVEKCCTFFPSWRKEQMMRYKHINGRIQNGLAYVLLIYALKKEGIFDKMPEFCYNEHGKPFLKNYPGWHFNLSHSKTAVCCTLSHKDIGIDIEDIGSYKDSLAHYTCNDEELKLLENSHDKAETFYMLWTQKEAVFKMIGSGITNDIKNILKTPYINIETKRIGNTWMSIANKIL